METWEIVLILILATIALIVLGNPSSTLNLIDLLDNSIFQLSIIGLTLAVATVSPAVSVVAIATIVVVYYMRNLIKIQMVDVVDVVDVHEEPRLNMREEITTVETKTTTHQVEISDHNHAECGKAQAEAVAQAKAEVQAQAGGAAPAAEEGRNVNTKVEDKVVVEDALKEHEDRAPVMSVQQFKIPATAPFEEVRNNYQDTFPNPRSSGEGFQADSTDPQAETRGPAPQAGTPTYQPAKSGNVFSVDTNIFTRATPPPQGFNEPGAEPTFRPYEDAAGQFGIAETRPYSNPQKYETADFIPGDDMGSNNYVQHGLSIDDKITNLRNGIVASTAPPPNFDAISPVWASQPAR